MVSFYIIIRGSVGELMPTFVMQNFVLRDKIKRKRSGQTENRKFLPKLFLTKKI